MMKNTSRTDAERAPKIVEWLAAKLEEGKTARAWRAGAWQFPQATPRGVCENTVKDRLV